MPESSPPPTPPPGGPRGLVRQYGPDATRQFYKLHQDLLRAELEPVAKLVLMELLHRAGQVDAFGRSEEPPSKAELARTTCSSEKSVQRALRALEADHYVLRHCRSGKASVYLACFPAIGPADPQRIGYLETFRQIVHEETGELVDSTLHEEIVSLQAAAKAAARKGRPNPGQRDPGQIDPGQIDPGQIDLPTQDKLTYPPGQIDLGPKYVHGTQSLCTERQRPKKTRGARGAPSATAAKKWSEMDVGEAPPVSSTVGLLEGETAADGFTVRQAEVQDARLADKACWEYYASSASGADLFRVRETIQHLRETREADVTEERVIGAARRARAWWFTNRRTGPKTPEALLRELGDEFALPHERSAGDAAAPRAQSTHTRRGTSDDPERDAFGDALDRAARDAQAELARLLAGEENADPG